MLNRPDNYRATRCRIDLLEDRIMLTTVVIDLDMDGDADVLADRGQGWFENVDGQFHRGRFQSPTDAEYIMADIDGNGSPEIITPSIWHEFSGGQFIPHWYPALPESIERISQIKVFDYQADGDLDIVGRATDLQFVLFENTDGKGTMGIPVVIDAPQVDHLVAIEAEDFDFDGDLDFLSHTHLRNHPGGSEKLSWHLNDGAGDFETRDVFEYIRSPEDSIVRTFEIVDIDGDGDVDILQEVYHGTALFRRHT